MNPLELAIVENHVAQRARYGLRGFRGMSGDPQSQRHVARTINECHSYEDWLFVNGGNLGIQGPVSSNGTMLCLTGYTSSDQGWIRATFSMPDGRTVEAANPYRPDIGGGVGRGSPTLWAPGPEPTWIQGNTLVGVISNGWAVGLGLGALALIGGSVYWWRRR